ncbi:MAG: hypothetical protein WCO23_02580 [bacterium]
MDDLDMIDDKKDDEEGVIDPARFLQAYKENIFNEAGLAKLGQAEKDEFSAMIDTIIDQRIINLILTQFPSDKKEQLADLIENEGLDKSLQFAFETIPTLKESIVNELYEVQKDILERMGKK